MGAKLTKAQKEMLRLLGSGPRDGITDECVVKALARRGLAERYSEKVGHLNMPASWRITEAGRALLQSGREERA